MILIHGVMLGGKFTRYFWIHVLPIHENQNPINFLLGIYFQPSCFEQGRGKISIHCW